MRLARKHITPPEIRSPELNYTEEKTSVCVCVYLGNAGREGTLGDGLGGDGASEEWAEHRVYVVVWVEWEKKEKRWAKKRGSTSLHLTGTFFTRLFPRYPHVTFAQYRPYQGKRRDPMPP